jgi:hypothetical protein
MLVLVSKLLKFISVTSWGQCMGDGGHGVNQAPGRIRIGNIFVDRILVMAYFTRFALSAIRLSAWPGSLRACGGALWPRHGLARRNRFGSFDSPLWSR